MIIKRTSIAALILTLVMTTGSPLAVYAEGETYSVKYEYENSGSLPSAVKDTLPADTETYEDGKTVKAKDPSARKVTADRKVYTFDGWDEDEKTINGADLLFTGTWKSADIIYSISGTLSQVPYSGSGSPKALNGEKVVIECGDGTMDLDTGEDGTFGFSFAPEADISEDGKYNWTVEATKDHYAGKGQLSHYSSEEDEVISELTVKERFEATDDDYAFASGDKVRTIDSQTYVNGSGTYTLEGKSSSKLADTLDGTPKDALDVTVSDDGTVSGFYVYHGDECSKVYKDASVKVDKGAPVINSVTTEAANGNTYVKQHGIYGKQKAELVIDADITEDTEIKEVRLISRKDGEETTYLASKTTESGSKYNVVIGLPDEETLMDAQLVKLVAEDIFGNTSSEVIIAQTEDGSKVTLEQIAPKITKGDSGKKSSYGWYSEMPTLTASASDEHSGLASLSITGNGTDISESYESRTNEEKTVSGTASVDKESSDGTYTYTVTAVDNSGNTATDEIKVKIDTVKPSVSAEGITNGGIYASVPAVTIEENEKYASEEGNRITASITRDGTKVADLTFSGSATAGLDSKYFSEDGTYTIVLGATDAAGNEADSKTYTFTKDSSAPEVTITDSGKKSSYGWYAEMPDLTAKAAAPVSGLGSLSISGHGVDREDTYPAGTTEEQTVQIKANIDTESSDGSYTYKAVAVNKAGSKAEKSVTVKIDTEKPSVTASGIKNNGIYASVPDVTVTEDEKYSSVEGNRIFVSITRDGTEVYSKVFEKTDSASLGSSLFSEDGAYTLRISAKDAADNDSGETAYNFIKDSTVPEITKSESGKKSSYGWYSEQPELSATATDAQSGLKSLSLSGQDKSVDETYPEGTTDAKTVRFKKAPIAKVSDNGSYTYEIVAENHAGLIASDGITVKIDTEKPDITADGIKDGGFYSSEPEITLTEDERYPKAKGNRIIVRITKDGRKHYSETFERVSKVELDKKLFSDDASYSMEIQAKDAADNESETKKYRFIKDSTKPEVSIEHNGEVNENGWLNKIPRVSAYAKDGLSGLTALSITQDRNDDPSISRKYDRSFDQEHVSTKADLSMRSASGRYLFTAKARDKAGNVSTAKLHLKIDTKAPEIKASGVKSGSHYRTVPAIKVSEDEQYYSARGARIFYKIRRAGKVVKNSHVSRKNELTIPSASYTKDGDYKVTIYAVDAAGNKSNVLSYSFTKDTQRPVVSITGVSEGRFYNRPQTVTVKVTEHNYSTDKVSVTAKRQLGNAVSNPGFPWKNKGVESSNSKSFSETGTYTITASATDKAGNASGTKTVSFTVDTKAPEIDIKGISDGAVYLYGESPSPKVSVKDDYLASKSVSYTKAGETVTNPSFEQTKENDGLYTMTATATDKAGNTTTKQLSFTINRFGSHFDYDTAVRDIMGKAVRNVDEDLVIIEKNLSKVVDTENRVYRDGKRLDTDARTDEKGAPGDYTYRHVFDKDIFADEGAYEINVFSKDKDGNEMESKEENGKVVFYVDRTEPSLSVEGIDPKGVTGEKATLTVRVSDLLTGTGDVKATVNGEEVKLTETDEAGVLTFDVGEGMRQSVRVTAKDAAGNEAEFEDTLSVSASPVKLWLDRFGKFLGLGAGAAALAGGGFALAKRKKDDDEEDRAE